MKRLTDDVAGFTLIEILMVTALLAILSTTIFATWNGVVRSKQAIDSERISTRTAEYVLSRMMRELSSYVKEPLAVAEGDIPRDPGSTAFPSANEGSASIYFLGTNKSGAAGSSDSIRFVSSSAGQAQLGTLANFGLVEIEYRLEKPKETTIGSPEAHDDEYVLVREEKPAAVTNEDIREKRKFLFPLAEHVTALNFRYFDGAVWKEAWTGASRNVPEAVEITFSLRSESGATQSFRTAVGLFRREPGS